MSSTNARRASNRRRAFEQQIAGWTREGNRRRRSWAALNWLAAELSEYPDTELAEAIEQITATAIALNDTNGRRKRR
jgi:hypothetical protein